MAFFSAADSAFLIRFSSSLSFATGSFSYSSAVFQPWSERSAILMSFCLSLIIPLPFLRSCLARSAVSGLSSRGKASSIASFTPSLKVCCSSFPFLLNWYFSFSFIFCDSLSHAFSCFSDSSRLRSSSFSSKDFRVHRLHGGSVAPLDASYGL